MMQEDVLTARSHDKDVPIVLLPEQEQQLALINHMASFGNMLLAVTGLTGSGKSTLAFELLRRHTDLELTLLINADLMFGIPSLLRRIGDIDQISLPDNRGQAIEILRQQSQIRAEQGKKLLVVIDQAEQIDANTLNEIAHLALTLAPGVAFILFGITGYEQHVRTSPVQASVHTQALPPISEEGARTLLQRYFFQGQILPISDSEFIKLYSRSSGLPGALLILASDFFSANVKTNKIKKKTVGLSAVSQRLPIAHIAALALLAVALLASYLYKPNQNQTKEVELTQTVTWPPVKEPEDVLRGLPLPEPQKTDAVVSTPEPVVAPQISVSDVKEEPVGAPDYNYQPSEPVLAAPPKIKTTVSAAPVISRHSNQTVKQQSDKEKLLAINQGVVVQLFGSFDLDNANKFRKNWQSRLDKALYQYETKNNNQSWYVVVVGVYKNKVEATNAIKAWPNELKAGKPWVRDIKDIKAVLR